MGQRFRAGTGMTALFCSRVQALSWDELRSGGLPRVVPVVKNLPADARDAGDAVSVPSPERCLRRK